MRIGSLPDLRESVSYTHLDVYKRQVLVDARGDQSPLKVLSFTTPDNTVPGFADGYPYMSKVTNVSAQVTVMATKSCRLYWALLPKGAQAQMCIRDSNDDLAPGVPCG